MDFEQAKKVLQLTDVRIRKFGSIDTSTSREIHEAIFKFQPFQRLAIAYHAQEALTHLREQTVPLANSLEQLIATAINLNHAEFREFTQPAAGRSPLCWGSARSARACLTGSSCSAASSSWCCSCARRAASSRSSPQNIDRCADECGAARAFRKLAHTRS